VSGNTGQSHLGKGPKLQAILKLVLNKQERKGNTRVIKVLKISNKKEASLKIKVDAVIKASRRIELLQPVMFSICLA
jgi:hypothetical protein